MSEMSPAQTPTTGASKSGEKQTGSVQPEPEDDGLLTADLGPDRNERAEADVSDSEEAASDPMPDIAGTGS